MSSSSGSSSIGTCAHVSRAMRAVSRVREKRVWTISSIGTFASCFPSRAASSRPCSVSPTGTDGSPLIRCARLSSEWAWREST